MIYNTLCWWYTKLCFDDMHAMGVIVYRGSTCINLTSARSHFGATFLFLFLLTVRLPFSSLSVCFFRWRYTEPYPFGKTRNEYPLPECALRLRKKEQGSRGRCLRCPWGTVGFQTDRRAVEFPQKTREKSAKTGGFFPKIPLILVLLCSKSRCFLPYFLRFPPHFLLCHLPDPCSRVAISALYFLSFVRGFLALLARNQSQSTACPPITSTEYILLRRWKHKGFLHGYATA